MVFGRFTRWTVPYLPYRSTVLSPISVHLTVFLEIILFLKCEEAFSYLRTVKRISKMSKKVMLSVSRDVYFKFSCLGMTSIPHCITLCRFIVIIQYRTFHFEIRFPHAKSDKISFVVFVVRVSKGLPRNDFFQKLKTGLSQICISKIGICGIWNFGHFKIFLAIVEFGIWKVTGAGSSLRANYNI